MKLKEFTAVMSKKQNVMIMPNIGDCGFYRYTVEHIPPMFLNAEVRDVRSHGYEIAIMVFVEG